ncbi:hypothetical protein [Paenibacillus macquariensis]|uniref:Cthe-2314-like HEPN domain-containing protein n=1 Tax=Paenibacillus macquariensis TaxID=948756 RepID=A0ABY1JM48_9BACL|nr:hypothetical protein [Paenibacillus macquariensis]MEC0090603.1 hypothetical protein [Paenibacillus macquariensis]OAB25024.1 hypothetical protein PMSM_28750 [Paenibacillus macquariensis subsp. macquariensis]SIQ44677.1 hypothetical protein SAMN05421578_10229 [Paenibacillus macquariensis]
MQTIENNYNLLLKNVKYKIEHLDSELDSITDVIPVEVEIDWGKSTVRNTYFIPESEEEYKEIEGYIISFIELLNKTLSEEYTHIYTFIESSTNFTIDELQMTRIYKKYKKNNRNNKSEFSCMINFIDGNIYKFDQNDYLLFDFIDSYIRESRNDVVHKFHKSKEKEIISEILPDNENVDGRLRTAYAYFLETINCLYEVAHYYKLIISKAKSK